jgi:hypothetical protein
LVAKTLIELVALNSMAKFPWKRTIFDRPSRVCGRFPNFLRATPRPLRGCYEGVSAVSQGKSLAHYRIARRLGAASEGMCGRYPITGENVPRRCDNHTRQ